MLVSNVGYDQAIKMPRLLLVRLNFVTAQGVGFVWVIFPGRDFAAGTMQNQQLTAKRSDEVHDTSINRRICR